MLDWQENTLKVNILEFYDEYGRYINNQDLCNYKLPLLTVPIVTQLCPM